MSDTYNGAEGLLSTAPRLDVAGRRTARQRNFAGGAGVTFESGLPLAWQDGAPVAPSPSFGRTVQFALKRVLLDIPLSLMALIVLAPLLIGIAIAVRVTSAGPALFAQNRVGLNGRVFRMLKFRTMRTETCDDSGLAQVVANDDRVTRIGRFLRATSIDELPQLWNILVGDMAIIGPRPMVEGMQAAGMDYRDAVPYYDHRHLVKPGLSGWAQANGLRGPTTDLASARQRIDHDCAYVQNVSFVLDIKIIIRTILREFLTGSGV
jgi:lipopolysaccharide/colanic/teichoic acid biosynthesis glycosyltransferase